jgi:LacI family transcriptional regulator
MNTAGLTVNPDYIYQSTPTSPPDGGYEGCQYLLSLPKRPSAIICYNDYMAMGVYKSLLQAGLRIPQDISVTGFDNIKISGYLNPTLTTLHQFKHELGVEAAKMMLEMLEKDSNLDESASNPKKVSLKGTLIIRESTTSPS